MIKINRELLLKVVLIQKLRNRLKFKRKSRTYSIRPIFFNRNQQGERILAQELRNDPEYHHKYFRMNKEIFDEILSLISAQLVGKRTHSRPITPLEKLAIAIRYLATGGSQVDLSFSYRISQPSISKILREVFTIIVQKLGPIHLPQPTEEIWQTNSKQFESIWNFPLCCGALDGKHIRIQAPDYSGSLFHNYKGFFSINLMAITDPTYKFSAVSIGACGSQSDGGVFNRSAMGISFENGTLTLPPPKTMCGLQLPHVIVSDAAFTLKKYIMKPFGGQQLSREKRVFNLRLSRARNVVENSFGILQARWRIFQKPITADLHLTKLIVNASIILHNFLMNKKDSHNLTVDSEFEDGSWRAVVEGDTGMTNLPNQGSNNYSYDAKTVRNTFTEYFVGEGALDWQWKRIESNS